MCIHYVLLQIVIIYDYALIDWGIVYDYHTQDSFTLFFSLLHHHLPLLSSMIITLIFRTSFCLPLFFSSSFCSCSSASSSLMFFFLPSFWPSFTLKSFFLLPFVGVLLTFIYKYVLYLFFQMYIKYSVLDKCTWYLTKQHWDIVRTIQIMW